MLPPGSFVLTCLTISSCFALAFFLLFAAYLKRICTVLDKTSMFGVTSTKKDGEQRRHHVRSKADPLACIYEGKHYWIHATFRVHR